MAVKSITPFLWFKDKAEDAAAFYVGLFDNARILRTSYYGAAGPGPKGSVMVVEFELEGQRISALNGGPNFQLDEAFSLVADCTTQADIDRLWTALGDGGSYNVCGWLKDRFGVSWQITCAGLAEWISGDQARADRVMAALMKMTKIDIQALTDAAG